MRTVAVDTVLQRRIHVLNIQVSTVYCFIVSAKLGTALSVLLLHFIHKDASVVLD